MGMTARQILKSAIPSVKKAAQYVVVKKVTPGIMKSGAHKITVEAYSTATADGTVKRKRETYKCVVYGLNKNTRLNKDEVKVSCTCDSFCFTSEWALKRQGAADIIHSNGEPPDVRNPRYIPTPCKHLFRVLEELVKHKV